MKDLPRRLTAEEGERYEGPEEDVLVEPPRDEDPAYELDRDMANAVAEACQGNFSAAAVKLRAWDTRLREQGCLSKWFELRLQIVALERLAGRLSSAQALAKPLREMATSARDGLTLRRLTRVLDEAVTATPTAAAGPFSQGPFADRKR